jgi:hypothetical protein
MADMSRTIKKEWTVLMKDPDGSEWRVVEFDKAYRRERGGYGMIHPCETTGIYMIRHSSWAIENKPCDGCKSKPPETLFGFWSMLNMGAKEGD